MQACALLAANRGMGLASINMFTAPIYQHYVMILNGNHLKVFNGALAVYTQSIANDNISFLTTEYFCLKFIPSVYVV